MNRILIRHMNGARQNQVDEFDPDASDILVGRDLSAHVRFDPSTDDVVSRQHLRIAPDPMQEDTWMVVDLQSRNGSFLNRQRIYGPARLTHNDLIQLGPGGPEFRFEVDPPPPGAPPVSPLAESLPRPTREYTPEQPISFGAATPAWTSGSEPRPVGRATVERMLGDTFGSMRKESNKSLWVAGAALAAIVLVGVGVYTYLRQTSREVYQATRRNQESIQQMDADVKKQPEAAEALRRDVEKLQAELSRSQAMNQESLRALTKAMAAERAENAKGRVQPNYAPPSPGGALPAVRVPADFESALNSGLEKLRAGDAVEALGIGNVLIEREPDRWEGYSLAGSALLASNKLNEARAMLTKALNLAPDSMKPGLEKVLKQVENR